MRFMLIVKATKDSEANVMPTQELVEAMQRYNEELIKAGVLLAADGLHSSEGAVRISYPEPGGKAVIMDGPFAETKELIAGYTLIEVKSREEALEWALRMPDPHGFGEGQIEVRQVFEFHEIMEDPDTLSKEAAMREELERANRK